VQLAGSLWEPAATPVATVVMHPGSGPSDRHNDLYFPEIRHHLLTAGIAVASFDKRGVGGSTGHWQDAGIVEQADDACAAIDALTVAAVARPIGIFGHSQGGWVALEVAARGGQAEFVITNSGPGVSPALQDRFALVNEANQSGRSEAETDDLLAAYDRIVDSLRTGISFVAARARLEGHADDPSSPLNFLSDDERTWELARKLIDHDPRPAMRALRVPLLAVFGSEDAIVPVETSVDVYRTEVREDLLDVAVFDGGNHRAQHGDPPRLVDGYAGTVVSFVAGCARDRSAR
jgi:pimeloyl-ACP methyl ester carboxylesterase